MSPLINELVSDFHAPAAQEGVLENLRHEQQSRPQKLVATWAPEYGWLNRVITLWEGPAASLSPLTRIDPPTDWLSMARTARQLTPRRPIRTELLSYPLLELRTYATHDGACENFVNALLNALPHREKYSPNAGVWTTRERGTDLVYHLWAYESLSHRMAARDAAMSDVQWSMYRVFIRQMLSGLQASLLAPIAI